MFANRRGLLIRLTILLVVAGVVVGVAVPTRARWLPKAQEWLGRAVALVKPSPGRDAKTDEARDEHAGHDHAHDDQNTIELSLQAAKNIGLKTEVVKPRAFERTITVPAVIVERPGRSQIAVGAPLTGVVTQIFAVEGEAVAPGQKLFELRLSHEELVSSQAEFLQLAAEMDVVDLEIKRLEDLGDKVIPGTLLIAQKYEKQKKQALFDARREGLLLHGLTEEQADQVYKTRKPLRTMTVLAPPLQDGEGHAAYEHLFHVQKLNVRQGEQAEVGAPLSILADHCELFLEGKAFEDDAPRLIEAAREHRPLNVRLPGAKPGGEEQVRILFLSDTVEVDSREFHFYMNLPNTIVQETRRDDRRYIAWKYRPGQRMEVLVPVERWEDRVVLPLDAVVDDGAESYVFAQNGKHFDRLPVHVEYRDTQWAVIENDGILEGSMVAVSGAYQLHVALKNKAGGGIDPHAGHQH
ncbi:MAG: efflux RND transporter periplasmic adaptor subunit [Planctomycetia bacterium]|nr:efflux RND transporter periplasmic adaptor subunit [Planctomycetia bacterium]